MQATGLLRWTYCPYHYRQSWHVLRQDGYLLCLWCLIMGNDKAIHLPAFHPADSYVPAPADILVDPGPVPQPTTTMQKVCAWCGKDMGTIDGKGQTGTTHGICPECKEIELGKIRNRRTH